LQLLYPLVQTLAVQIFLLQTKIRGIS
jgi:hypothetical protein